MAYILVVEDDAWLADCYRTWLTAAGYAVRQASSAQAALDVLDEELPQLILLDLLLPHANGMQLLHTLQSYADFARVPVVLCSSALPAQLPSMALYGVHRTLDKATLSPRRLQQVVKEVLAHAAV